MLASEIESVINKQDGIETVQKCFNIRILPVVYLCTSRRSAFCQAVPTTVQYLLLDLDPHHSNINKAWNRKLEERVKDSEQERLLPQNQTKLAYAIIINELFKHSDVTLRHPSIHMNTSTLRPPSKCPMYAIAWIISGYTVMMASAFVSTIPLTKLQAPNKMQIIRPQLILPKDLLYHRNVGIHTSQPGLLFSSTALLMTTSQMNLHANVAVRLDTPLLAPEQFQPTPIVLWRAFLLLITSDAFKTASFAFLVAFSVTLAVKKSLTGKPSKLSPLSKASSSIVRIIAQSITNQLNTVRGRISRTMEEWSIRRERKLQSGESPMKSAAGTVPMKFNVSDPVTQGWGVCTLLSKKKMGRSRYMQYEFSLPQANNTLALALGQQIALSCLDSGKNVVRGDFYLASPRNGKGKFSILLPDSPPVPDMSKASGGSNAGKLDSQALANLEYELGKDSGNFVSI